MNGTTNQHFLRQFMKVKSYNDQTGEKKTYHVTQYPIKSEGTTCNTVIKSEGIRKEMMK